ncbi:MAG TPA: KaiC 1, partial [Firmicutes bacterium]|nr:KaiC 1 [Bacillota bacterium]
LSASTGGVMEHTNISISPLIDTWLQLSNREDNGEYNRGIFILKSRGMAHSNQIREFLITDHGIELMDVYLGPGGMLAGSARLEEEARAEMERLARWQETERRQRELERKRHALEAQISSLREAFSNEEAELMQTIAQEQLREVRYLQDRLQVAKNRHADEDQQKEILNKGI